MTWLCLFAGPSGSGKTTLMRRLEACSQAWPFDLPPADLLFAPLHAIAHAPMGGRRIVTDYDTFRPYHTQWPSYGQDPLLNALGSPATVTIVTLRVQSLRLEKRFLSRGLSGLRLGPRVSLGATLASFLHRQKCLRLIRSQSHLDSCHERWSAFCQTRFPDSRRWVCDFDAGDSPTWTRLN